MERGRGKARVKSEPVSVCVCVCMRKLETNQSKAAGAQGLLIRVVECFWEL